MSPAMPVRQSGKPAGPVPSPQHPFTVAFRREAEQEGLSDEAIARFCTVYYQEVTAALVAAWRAGKALPKGRALAKLRGLLDRLKNVPIGNEPAPTGDDRTRNIERAEKKAEKRRQERADWSSVTTPPRRFGPAVTYFRVLAGYQPQDVAFSLGTRVNTPLYCSWERGDQVPDLEFREEILRLFEELGAAITEGRVDDPWKGAVSHLKPRIVPIAAFPVAAAFNTPRIVPARAKKVPLRSVPSSSAPPAEALKAPPSDREIEDAAKTYAVAIRAEAVAEQNLAAARGERDLARAELERVQRLVETRSGEVERLAAALAAAKSEKANAERVFQDKAKAGVVTR